MSHDVSTSYPLDSGRVLLRDAKVLETYQAKSKDMEVLSKSQDGGMVTTLAIKALEREVS